VIQPPEPSQGTQTQFPDQSLVALIERLIDLREDPVGRASAGQRRVDNPTRQGTRLGRSRLQANRSPVASR
jgi:hypothetical protein